MRDRYAAQILDDSVIDVDVTGEGADEIKRDKNNLVIKAMMRGFEFMDAKPRGIALRQLNVIPHGRGLGSSAAAIIAGLILARALVVGGEERLPDDALLALASELEGHPDNVAACLYGGVTVAWTTDAGAISVLRVEPSERIVPVACVPSTAVATKKARGMLPETVPHADAAFNAARAALLVSALTGRTELLMDATDDRLHQPYRRPAFPRSSDLVAKLRGAGIPATVSGAGPTVLALASSSTAPRVEVLAGARFETRAFEWSLEGAHIVPLGS